MRHIFRNTSSLSRGYLIVLTGTALWSTTAIIIRHLNDAFGMSAMAVAFWRDFWVSLLLWGFFALFNPAVLRLRREEYSFLLWFGLLLAVFNSLWTISVKVNGAAVSTVLIYSSAAFTALYERWFQKMPLGLAKGSAILLSLGGSVLAAEAYTAASWKLNPWGLALGLLSAIAFTVYSLVGKQAAVRRINSWTALVYSFSAAVVFLGVFNLLEDHLSPQATLARLTVLGASWEGWGWMILLAAVPSIGGYGLYTLSLRYLRASVSNLIATLEPSMTALLAYLLLGERFSLAQLGGGLLILAGVVLVRYGEGGGVRRPDGSGKRARPDGSRRPVRS